MRIIRYEYANKASWGVLEGDKVHPVLGLPYESLEPSGESLPLEKVKLLAPVVPSKIVAVGKNYRDHALEMNDGIPENPILFIKSTACVIGPGETIPRPENAGRIDYEGELAFVVGKTAKNVKRQDAAGYIFGYTALNDVTARELQKKDGQWTRAKGFDGFAPVGPWIETELDPDNIDVITRLNGVVKQSANTSILTWGVYEIMEFITACMTLLPGDVVATGTPAGIGPMQPGDIVEVEVGGIGVLQSIMG